MKSRAIVVSLLGLVVYLLLARSASAVQCWTVGGSTGTVDEENLSQVSMANSDLQVSSTAPLPASVKARYAVTGIFEDDFTVARQLSISLRYRDNGSLGDGRVQVLFQQQAFATGALGTWLNFDSNNSPQASGFQKIGFSTPCETGGGLSLLNNLYFFEVTLTKNVASANPTLEMIQVCVNDCGGWPPPNVGTP
ncbi:MAG TPA: hypothetical protein VF173_02070 [Thermoanaerobaculia bacterium]|nr:hypothetical protein [Thermoanaerobaculia bacterium]